MSGRDGKRNLGQNRSDDGRRYDPSAKTSGWGRVDNPPPPTQVTSWQARADEFPQLPLGKSTGGSYGASSDGQRGSRRGAYKNYETYTPSAEINSRQAHEQQNRWHQDDRGEQCTSRSSSRSGSRSAPKYVKSNEGYRDSSNRASFRRQAREHPVEWDKDRHKERTGERREKPRGVQQENRHIQQSQSGQDSPDKIREEFQQQCGLVPGNHTITQIVQTKPDATSSKQGTSGEPVRLVANYFQILKRPTWQLYLYRVDISPEIHSRCFRSGLLNDQIKKFGAYLFDGTMLYMMVKLDKDVTEFKTKGKKDDKPYLITIKLVGLVSKDTYQYLHAWSILLRKCEKTLGLQLVGRNYYDPVQKKRVTDHKIELWPGFLTAIHQHERDILLCVDISTKVMRTETVYDIMQKCRRRDNGYNMELLQNKVLGTTVRTTYSDKTYRIHDFNFEETPESTFALKTGETISYIDYFVSKYDRTQIRDRQQPLLVVKSSDRQVRSGQSKFFQLVPELCFATGIDDQMRKNHSLMKVVANFTSLKPKERLNRSQAFVQRLQNSARMDNKSRDIFKDFNFQLGNNPVDLQGRRLIDEQIIFGGQKTKQSTNWTKSCIDEMYVSVHLKNWALIYPRDKSQATRQFVGDLQSTAKAMKYNIENPKLCELLGGRCSDYENALRKVTMQDPQLIFCVLTYPDVTTYKSIKKYCIETVARPSQVLVIRTYENKDKKTIATKIAIQMNCKLGGVPWMINIRLSGLMTIGFDVYHETKDRNKKSLGAMVATMDMQKKQKFFSVVSDHIGGVELSDDVKLLTCQVLRQYTNEHGTLPEKILFYRDGVGEGQIPYVRDVEIKNILDGLRYQYGDREVPLTYIVVTKRINARFFSRERGDCKNPLPGTIVDDVITLPERHDFFLVSQSVNKGTVSPTNYNILHNKTGLSTDNLQKLTYQMTYLYYNYCATVAVPAVCHYAHRLAFMVGSYDLKPSNDDLQKTLYFL